jgi:RNA polymerase sigma-70 factor (ECF subfamily)
MAANGLSDELLLGRAKNGSAECFSEIYRRHEKRVYRFVRELCGNDSVAQEVTQEVFLTLLRGLDGYDSARGALLPYLLGVARNLASRRLREDRPLVPLDAGIDTDGEGAGGATLPQLASPECLRSELENREALAALRKAIGSLPLPYREVLALCDLEELDYAQAAQALEIPIGTVRSRLHRARALLMERWLSDKGSQATVRYTR